MMQLSNGMEMDNAVLTNYLCNLVNLFFKILPLRESGQSTLGTYMASLQAELSGCKSLVVALHEDSMYLSLLSILQHLIDNQDDDVSVFKREVFKAISICNKLRDRYTAEKAVKEDCP